jgi:glycosyltransferase involved in cell wall biosynthesis
MLSRLPQQVRSEGTSNRGRPLRVALVSSSSGSRGGGEFYLVGLAQGLVALGYDVQSVLSEHCRMDELAVLLLPHGPVHRVPYRNTYDRRLRSLGAATAVREVRRIGRQLADVRADVIHINKQNIEDGLDLLRASRGAGGALVATVHVTRSMTRLRALGGTVRDWISARVLRSLGCPLIAISQSGLTELAALGIDRAQLHLVHNGVSSPPLEDRDAVRRRWRCGPEHVVMGCVARLEPQKNPLFLLDLLPHLPPHVRLVWIGDGSLMEPMRQRVAMLGLADRVILPGWQANARSSMAGFDIFVLPSLYEGFPLAVLEAMAAGLPCIASDVDGVQEAVLDGQTGRVCPPGATQLWLAGIGTYLDEAARRRAGVEASARYRDQFSLEIMAQKTADVYERILLSEPKQSGQYHEALHQIGGARHLP